MKHIVTALCACLCLIAIAGTGSRADGLKAAVKLVGGVPRLVVDGQPIRPRIFWGDPGSSSVDIKAGEQSLSFEFSPEQDEPHHAMLMIRFQHVPSHVLIKNVHLVDLTTQTDIIPPTTFGDQAAFNRDWAFWPANSPSSNGSVQLISAGADGSEGGVELAQRAPDAGKPWADTHIYNTDKLALYASHQYRFDATLTSDVDTLAWFSFYRDNENNTYEPIGGIRDLFGSQIAEAAASGVNIITYDMDMPWAKPGEKQDTHTVDALDRLILRINPKALILPCFYVRPPKWWLDAHPGDEMKWIGTGAHQRTATVASQAFRDDASSQLEALVAHMEQTCGDHVLGYHVGGQNTYEWFYLDSWGPDWNGYADADTTAFRKWLAAKYGGDDALRKAWNQPTVSLATAAVPTPEERGAGKGELRDPATQQNVIDFTRFQQENMADCICQFAHVVKEATHGGKIFVTFYGYAYEFGGMVNGPGNSGHYALRRLLDSPDIDCIASPWAYQDRGLIGTEPIMVASDSVALAGKLYIPQDDTATSRSLGTAPGANVRVSTAADTNKILIRNSAEAALRNLGIWWFDLGTIGWFDDPAYWKALDAFSVVEQSQLENARPYRPEIASVVDERSIPLLAAHDTAGRILSTGCFALGRCGAPYGQYLQDDVAAGRVHAKLYLFESSYRLDGAQRKQLLAATQGATRIWFYAPGYLDGDAASLDAVKDLTGFEVKIAGPIPALVTPTPAGIALGLKPFGINEVLRPTLAVTDAAPGEALATYPDGSVAVAMRKSPAGTSIFIGTPDINTEMVRAAAKQAGVHLFTDTDAAVFANGPFLCVHATQDGPVTIDTGKPSEISDVMTGATLGTGPTLTLPMMAGDTRVLRY